MDQFVHPATLTPESQDGGFVVTFIDVPEAMTQGDSVLEALQQAADCLDEALVGRIRRREAIPAPSPVEAGQYAVTVPECRVHTGPAHGDALHTPAPSSRA